MRADNSRIIWPLLLFTLALFGLPATALAQDNPDQEAIAQRDVEVEVREEEPSAADTSQEVVTVRNDEVDRPHWLSVVGRNALWGGLTGGLIGLGAWLVTDRSWSPWTIAQFAGGGILVGAVVGGMELIVRGSDYAARPNSLIWMERDMPKTYELPIIQIDF